MCVIVTKEKGIDIPSDDILKKCFQHNSDGAGFMFNYRNRVYVRKGFMKYKHFLQELKKCDEQYNIKDSALVMHFRIATSGLKDSGACHPYPISKNMEHLRLTSFNTNIAVAHNGIIRMYNGSNKKYNDTQLFIKYVLYPLHDMNRDFIKRDDVKEMLEDITESKFAFLTSKGDIEKVGHFYEKYGYSFSNMHWDNVIPKYKSLNFWNYVDKSFDIPNSLDSSDYEYDPYTLYSDKRNSIIILDDDEKVTSSDWNSVYQNTSDFTYGYDPVTLDLYEVDDTNMTLSLIDNIQL